MVLRGGGDTAERVLPQRTIAVEGRALVGVLAVAQAGDALEGDAQRGRRLVAVPEPLGDGAVVTGDVLERLPGEPAASAGGEAVLGEGLQGRAVIGRVDEDHDIGVVLGGGAEHGGAADVDVLDALGEGGAALPGDDGAEGVEVAGDEVDRPEAVLGEGPVVFGQVAAGEDARVDGGVEGLHAAVEHLGEARDLLDAGNRHACRLDGSLRAACRDEFPAELVEPAGEVLDSGLVVDAQQSAHRSPPLLLFRRSKRPVRTERTGPGERPTCSDPGSPAVLRVFASYPSKGRIAGAEKGRREGRPGPNQPAFTRPVLREWRPSSGQRWRPHRAKPTGARCGQPPRRCAVQRRAVNSSPRR